MEAATTETPRRSRTRVSHPRPPVGTPVPDLDLRLRLVSHEAVNPDPQRWFRIMERADTGDTGPMIDMFSDARDRDQHLDGVARKRAQSMMGRPIAFRPPDGLESDKEALEIAVKVRQLLLFQSRSFRSMLTHLMQAPVDSYAVAPLEWTTTSDGLHVPHMLPPERGGHANRYCFDRDTLKLSFYRDAYRIFSNVSPLDEYPDSFVAHTPIGGRSDYPWRRGAMRAAIIPSFIKRNGLKFWLTLAERFGMPIPYATVPLGEDHDDESTTDAIALAQTALDNLNRIFSMVVTEDIKVESIPGSQANITGEVHRELMNWASTVQSIGMLGQNLTTEVSGGSFAAAESHRYVAADLHLADATELSETVTQQIVEPVVRYNWPGAPVPVCEISVGSRQVFQVEDVREGIASVDERRRSLGHEALPDGAGAHARVQVQVPDAIESAPESPPESDAPTVGVVIEPGAEAKDPESALNGAQVEALKSIVLSVAAGELPRDSALALIEAAFPLSAATALKILGSVGQGFVPATDSLPGALP